MNGSLSPAQSSGWTSMEPAASPKHPASVSTAVNVGLWIKPSDADALLVTPAMMHGWHCAPQN